MRVTIVDYDPSWAERFAEQQHDVEELLAPWLAGYRPARRVNRRPRSAGEANHRHAGPGGLAGRSASSRPAAGRSRLAVTAPEDPAGYLPAVVPAPVAGGTEPTTCTSSSTDDPHAVAILGFRDALRADAVLRREYADLKERLARQHGDNRNAYTNAKDEFVARVVANAAEGADEGRAARVTAA